MSTGFAAEHASARADIGAAGQTVTFTKASATHDPATATFSGSSSATVTGAAMRVRGNPATFTPGRLVQADEVMLLFAPDTYGNRPELGSTVSWEGHTREVVAVNPLAPDGTDILSRVVIA